MSLEAAPEPPSSPGPTRWVRLPGLTPYETAHAAMVEAVAERARGAGPDTVFVVEHPPVITLGRRSQEGAVVAPGEVPVVEVERGGEATFHAPGQLVIYPVIGLRGARRDVYDHLSRLEEAVIRLLAEHGLDATRDPRNTGVWLGGQKVCSVGVHVRKWVTWHGLALNVDVDLAGFQTIRPCGFGSETMTRLADHGLAEASVESLSRPLAAHLAEVLELDAPNW